jgi:hypothetical protein
MPPIRYKNLIRPAEQYNIPGIAARSNCAVIVFFTVEGKRRLLRYRNSRRM